MHGNSTTKTCTHCKQTKPLSEFYKNRSTKDGYQVWCKSCRNEADRKRQRENADSIREYQRAYREKNAAVVKAKAKERTRRHYLANAEEINRQSAKYHADHPEWSRAAGRRYAARHKERRRAYQVRYLKEYPERNSERSSRRRARERAATIGKVSYKEIWERDKGACHICGLPVDRKVRHFEHVIPLCRGGAHSMDNIKVAHKDCNLKKGTRLMEEL